MALTVANIMNTQRIVTGINTPVQIVAPDNIEIAEVWLSCTVDMTVGATSNTSAATGGGFPLTLGNVWRLPLHIANASTPTAKQALWVNTAVSGTLSVMFFGTNQVAIPSYT